MALATMIFCLLGFSTPSHAASGQGSLALSETLERMLSAAREGDEASVRRHLEDALPATATIEAEFGLDLATRIDEEPSLEAVRELIFYDIKTLIRRTQQSPASREIRDLTRRIYYDYALVSIVVRSRRHDLDTAIKLTIRKAAAARGDKLKRYLTYLEEALDEFAP